MREAKDVTRGEDYCLFVGGCPHYWVSAAYDAGKMRWQQVSVWTVVVALTAPWMLQLIAWACE